MSIHTKFSRLGTDNAPGQEGRQNATAIEALMRETPLTGFRASEGFRCGVLRHGLPYRPGRVLCSNYRPEEAKGLVERVRQLDPPPDVLIVDGVEVAAAVRKAAAEIAVLAIGPRADPAVPVIEIPSFEIGRKAARMLLNRMETPSSPVTQEFLRPDLDKARARIFEARKRYAAERPLAST